MDVFEKLEEIEILEKKIKAVEKVIKYWLQKKFVEYEYKIRKVQATSKETNLISNVNYPVLNVSKGFIKENEDFTVDSNETVQYTYTLKDEKERIIHVQEILSVTRGDINSKEVVILYNIKIAKECYMLERRIPYINIKKQPNVT